MEPFNILLEQLFPWLISGLAILAVGLVASSLADNSSLLAIIKRRKHSKEKKSNIASLIDPNPGLQLYWKNLNIPVDSSFVSIYYPLWSCFSESQKDRELVDQLMNEFIPFFGPNFDNTFIQAVTTPANYFLNSILHQIEEAGGRVIPDRAHRHPRDIPEGARIVLFDYNINSGKSIINVAKYFKGHLRNPTDFWVFLYNDLVPDSERNPEWNQWKNKLKYYIKASDAIKLLSSDSKETKPLLEMLSIGDAIKGTKNWQDEEVIGKINELESEINKNFKKKIL